MPLYSGAVHYWRLDPSAWKPAIEAVAELGLGIVETYVPWGTHETTEGRFDFGESGGRRDVARFLDLIHDAGLLAFVRPGPQVNAEMTYFGLPERVIYDKACQARSPRQNPVILPWPPRMFPVPSYASTSFLRETGRWYDAVARVLAPRVWPEGPIVLVQVDNEAAYYFRNGPYDQDYHPDAVAEYRRFLERLHGSLDATAEAHRARYRTWDDVAPPESFDAESPEQLVPHLDWARFQESLLCTALTRMKRRMAQAGIKGVPITHNVPLGEGGLPVNVPAISSIVDLNGLDYYHAAREHRTIKRRTLYLSGTLDFAYAPELGVGAPPWFTPLTHQDSLYCAMCALAWGLRGFNLYMTVDRDRWYGAPIDARGRARPEAAQWRKLLSRLREVAFHELERRAEVALVVPQEYRRLSRATHLLGGVVSPSALESLGGTPVDACREDSLGFRGPVQILWWRMLAKVSDALTSAGVPYVYCDSDAPSSALRARRVLVAPAYEFASPERWEKLCEAAREGATVVYGPATPEMDERMQPRRFNPPRGSRRLLLDTPEEARALVADLTGELGLARPFPASPAPIQTSVHEDSVGPRVLFVMNPGRRAVRTTIQLPGPLTLVDALNDERFEAQDQAEVTVEGLTCRMFLLEAGPRGSRRSGKRPPRARRGER